MKASDRALMKELQVAAAAMSDLRHRSAIHAAIARLRQMSRGDPVSRMTVTPPAAAKKPITTALLAEKERERHYQLSRSL